jgi:hypothetical protein
MPSAVISHNGKAESRLTYASEGRCRRLTVGSMLRATLDFMVPVASSKSRRESRWLLVLNNCSGWVGAQDSRGGWVHAMMHPDCRSDPLGSSEVDYLFNWESFGAVMARCGVRWLKLGWPGGWDKLGNARCGEDEVSAGRGKRVRPCASSNSSSLKQRQTWQWWKKNVSLTILEWGHDPPKLSWGRRLWFRG